MKGLQRIERATDQLLEAAPFFGILAMGLKVIPSTEFETAATDGESLFVNLAFCDSLSDAELRGLLAHEVMHPASGHFARQGGRENDDWNRAGDYEINPELISCGFTLPQGALIDSRFAGWTAESIYAELQRQKQSKPAASGSGNGKPGNDPGRCGAMLPVSNPAAADQWQAKVIAAAAVAAKQAGTMPGSVKRLLERIHSPGTDWREALRRFITESNSRSYSWNRPNRRFIGQGLYLPGLVSNGRGRIIVAIDVSGSIDRAALEAFRGELQGAMDNGAADSVAIVYCDAAVQGTAEFTAGEVIGFETCGGGGTDFAPAMAWAADNAGGAACLVYFTDLECHSFGIDPNMPVIWANWSQPPGNSPPFGEVLQIDGHA